jgi:hypothetical protein
VEDTKVYCRKGANREEDHPYSAREFALANRRALSETSS